MKPLKLCVIAIALLLIPAAAGCRKRQAGTSSASANNSTAGPPLEQSPSAAGGTLPTGVTKYFRGSIGSTLGLQMKLTQEGDKISGSYYYQKVGTKIDLKGTVNKDGDLTLEEYDPAGKQTGLFKGSWKNDNEDGLASIAGSWSKPGGEKKTAFSLHEEPIEFAGGAEIVAKSIKEKNPKLKYSIDAEYPQVTGFAQERFEKFNQEAKSLATRKVSEFRKQMVARAAEASEIPTDDSSPGSDLGIGYTVAFANDDLISVTFDIGGYYQGAAHPNSYTEVVNYDVKAGKPLKLADLFNPGSKYLQTISAYCIKDLKKQSKANQDSLPDDMIAAGASPKTDNYRSWTISRKGLAIAFDSYQVGPYAAGPQSVLVPYSALKDLIKSDGPIGRFAQ